MILPKGGSMQVIDYHEAIFASELTANAKLTALAISKFYNWKEQKACWPSNKTLAKATGLSIRSIIRAKKELVNSGYLSSERRFNGSSVYVTLTPCHTVTTPVTQWQPNNEVNNEVNNETRDSDESLQSNINIKAEEIWRIFENEERTKIRRPAGRGNSGAGRSIKKAGRNNPSGSELTRFHQELTRAAKQDWLG